MFIPTKAEFAKAMKQGHLTTWLGLTEDAIKKHLKMTRVTAMGHMSQKRQNIHSISKEMKVPLMAQDF
jgi:hypothetical protein